MSRRVHRASGDLLDGLGPERPSPELLAPGAVVLRGFATEEAPALMRTLEQLTSVSPFRHMTTPGGYRMSVAMTSCGRVGWVTEPSGYRYDARDPLTTRPWPEMPEGFRALAARAAEQAAFPGFAPDACLINQYAPGARLSLHQDRDERQLTAPVVSVSLGLPAIFLFGSDRRAERPRRTRLASGDVVVWGGPARLAFHGVAPLADGWHPLTGRCRINLTFRQAL
jgi:alkylated DNA repair protein (DNA oxidative demethylase)